MHACVRLNKFYVNTIILPAFEQYTAVKTIFMNKIKMPDKLAHAYSQTGLEYHELFQCGMCFVILCQQFRKFHNIVSNKVQT